MEFCKKSSGFTTAELIIVMIVIAIISAIIIFSWPSRSLELNAIAEQVASEIRYTQSLAMTGNARYQFHYNSNSYWFTNGSGIPIIHHATGTTNAISLPSTIRFGTSGCGTVSTAQCIEFGGRGTPYVCGSTPSSNINIYICNISGTQSKQLTINHTTGYINKS